ncbi:hypothetical protein ILYODFUR_001470 [Ilyodon furcidens]|uniref:Uncharacterized protein n=1 Tax=Ilyodon furcidens TaxID=33524 RepID=A0ABV0TSS6_9TELE
MERKLKKRPAAEEDRAAVNSAVLVPSEAALVAAPPESSTYTHTPTHPHKQVLADKVPQLSCCHSVTVSSSVWGGGWVIQTTFLFNTNIQYRLTLTLMTDIMCSETQRKPSLL